MPTKCLLFQLPIALEYQTWYQIYAKVQPFYLMKKYANYLVIIFMILMKTLEMREKHRKMGVYSPILAVLTMGVFFT